MNLGGIALPTGLTVAPGQSAALSVTLSTPAPVDGVTVTLASSDTGILGVTPSVFISPGATTPSTAAQVTGIAYGSVTVTATAGGYTGDSQTVKVSATLSFSTQVVSVGAAGDQSINVLLSAPAPAGGLPITLQSSNTAVATVPPSVVIGAGSTTSPSFLVHGVAAGSATITASTTAPNVASATLPVTVLVYGSIGLPSGVTVGQSQSVPFPITLSAPAPPGGVTVTLSTSNSNTIDISPKLVTITVGLTQPATQPQVTGNGLGQATITATAPGFGSTSQPVTGNTTLSFAPTSLSITGLETKDFTLTLPTAAPAGGITVNLTASPTGVVTVPASVQIAQNATTAIVHVTGVAPGTATVTAAATSPNVGNATGSVTVLSAGAIGLPSNVTLALGESKAFPVTLPVAAPQGGVSVTLTSDSPKVGISPGTVTIDAGQTQPAAQPQVTGNSPGTANITASAPAYTSTTKAVQVTATISFTPPSLSLSSTATQNLTLTLSGPAPSGGLVFNVSSTNTSVATVGSPTATIQGGVTTTTIAVTAVAAGSAVIHASAANLTDASANVTVSAGADIIVPASLSVPPGESVILPISLANPAQSLMFFDLTSSDPTKATLSTASITIPAGQTVSSNVVRIIGVATGATTIKVKSTNGTLAEATTAVTVGYTLTITPATLTILGNGNLATLTLTLSGPAPAGGIDFTLTSSNPSVATVPPSVTISASSTGIGARVISVGVGTTVIHVSAPNIPEATATVTVAPPGSVSLSAPATIGLSQTGTLTVTLSTPATGNGLSVDLTSSDPTKVSVSPSTVLVPAGSMTPVTQPQLTGVNVGNVTISASAQGFTPPAPLLVAVNATLTWISQNTTIAGIGNQVLLQLRLNATAPLAGLTVNMTSSNPAVATVQGISNFIWDGSSSPGILIPVTAVGFGTTIIHASGMNMPDVTTTVTVSGPLGITTTSLPNGNLGLAYNAAVAATGGATPFVWTATGLPAGLLIDSSSGAITGTPTVAGPATINVTVTDATSPTHLSVTKPFSVTIEAALVITTASLPNGFVGVAYSGPVAATGGATPFVWTATGLPAGLLIDSSSGAITGTPTVAGPATINVTVTDATSPTHLSVTKPFSVTIVAGLAITTTSLPGGQVGTAYNQTVAASGGTAPFHWSATVLPAGLTINIGTGAITGTPTSGGTSNVNFTVTDTGSTVQTANKTLSITIQSLTITTASPLPAGTASSAYSIQLTATGGVSPLNWSAPAVPRGLSLSSTGLLSGTPNIPGSFTISVSVSDASTLPQTASKDLFLTISALPLVIAATSPLPSGVINTAYTAAVTATGGTQPYLWTSTALPAGLTLDSLSGAITGTPTVAATSNVTITVTDSGLPTPQQVSKQSSLTVNLSVGGGTITVTNATVGANLQVPITITFTPALPIDATVTISSGNSNLVTLGSAAVVGGPSIQAILAAGTGSVNTFVKAFGSSGQVTITASVAGYTTGTGTVTLANSGFVVAGPNGIGGAFNTFQGVSSTLTVYAARLDSSGLLVETEQLRGGITVNVPIVSTVTTIGTVSSPTVAFSGGNDTVTTQFVANSTTTGVTNVIVGPVPPVSLFTQPATGASLTVTVNSSGLIPFSATIGNNLQKNVSIYRTGSTLNSAVVTVHSQDATKLKFSTTPTGATSATITVTIPVNQSFTPDFYAHAFGSTGVVTYTTSSPAYGSVDSTVSLAPSGFFVEAPGTMTVSPPNATVSVSTAWLDGTGSPQEIQAVASGVSISVAVASSNSLVGNVTVSPITIGAGSSNASTEFQAVGLGTAQITASAAGYGSGSVGVSVQGAGNLIVSNGLTIGQFLQDTGTVILPVAAPVGGLHVTLHSNSPLLMLSKTATGAGAATITIDFVQGQGNAQYFVQSLGSSSTATYTATAPGYGPGTDTVTMVPSGIVILGPGSVSLAGGPQSLTVFTAQLSASNAPVGPQALAGGASLTVSLTNSPGVAGSVPASVTVAAGASSTTALFTPLVSGSSTTVSVVQPSLWTLPTGLTSLGISVQP